MIAMLVISILLVVLYVGATTWTIHRQEHKPWLESLPESISAMVYLFEGGYKWLWTIWLWLVTFLMAPSLMEALPDEWRFLGFLTIACLLFCGAIPVFMEDHKKSHDVLGVAAGIFSQVCVLAICPWWLMVWVVMLVVIILHSVRPDWMKWADGSGVLIAELLCYLSLIAAIQVH